MKYGGTQNESDFLRDFVIKRYDGFTPIEEVIEAGKVAWAAMNQQTQQIGQPDTQGQNAKIRGILSNNANVSDHGTAAPPNKIFGASQSTTGNYTDEQRKKRLNGSLNEAFGVIK
ncbi:hypothetical protein MCHI_001274 [Candidatus Magnetoovum chiemensis]|nr:hypothetical protein MCHI_001274 [Candidatus Magnetoovum chiemensis]